MPIGLLLAEAHMNVILPQLFWWGWGGGAFNVVQGEEGGSSDLRRQGSSNGLRSPGVPASIHVTTL